MKVTIEEIGEIQSFGENGFTKREWVGVDFSNPTYPQYLKFECIKDKCQLLDSFRVGQDVDVEFNINGRKYDNPTKGVQYFVSLQSWKVKASEEAGDMTPERAVNTAIANDTDDDLPF